MIPAVPVPQDAGLRTPVDFKLKPGWHYDPVRHVFQSASGRQFKPQGDLPPHSKIVYKVPRLARADVTRLSAPEKNLRLHLQAILPAGVEPERYVDVIRAWPCVAEAHPAPAVSLPALAAPIFA